MAERIGRVGEVTLVTDGVVHTIQGHRIAFEVEKFGDPAPNRGIVRIYNLGRDQRRAVARRLLDIQAGPFTTLFLAAGHEDRASLLMRGEIIHGANLRTGPDWITQLEIVAFLQNRINALLEPASKFSFFNTPARAVVDVMFSALNVGQPRYTQEASTALSGRFITGAYSGLAVQALRRVLADYGLTFALDDSGPVVLRTRGAINPQSAAAGLLVLNVRNGLIGTPQVTKQGVVAKALLDARLVVGSRMAIESDTIVQTLNVKRQEYVLTKVRHVGDTRGDDWFTEITGAYADLGVQTAQPGLPPAYQRAG